MLWSNKILFVISLAKNQLGCSFVTNVIPLAHHEHRRQSSFSVYGHHYEHTSLAARRPRLGPRAIASSCWRRPSQQTLSSLLSKIFDNAHGAHHHHHQKKKKINRTVLMLSNQPSPVDTLIVPSKATEDEHSDDDINLNSFQTCLTQMSLPAKTQSTIISDVRSMGFTSSSELYNFAIDFEERPEVLSEVLRDDFGMGEYPPLRCHQIRAALMRLVRSWAPSPSPSPSPSPPVASPLSTSLLGDDSELRRVNGDRPQKLLTVKVSRKNGEGDDVVENEIEAPALVLPLQKKKESKTNGRQKIEKKSATNAKLEDPKNKSPPTPSFKSVVVNQKAKKRFSASSSSSSHTSASTMNYGLPTNYQSSFPKLATELDGFFHFMTHPSTEGQENPIREATAIVYLRHARLFIGWFWNYYRHEHNEPSDDAQKNAITTSKENLSLYDIIPNKDAQSTKPILAFILWLRHHRSISDSYEANMLRGLSKLVKFRFAKESSADPSYGEKSYQDIPAVRELRKLHRDAGKRTLLGPRSSDEDKKWLDWDEYLNVVKTMKNDVEEEIGQFIPADHPTVESEGDGNTSYTAAQRRIAIKLQNYLILAFFSSIPDRQRTFRELSLHSTFLRNDSLGAWTIKHGPDDYKTGKVYGDRPPLVIPPELTPVVDDFLKRWRPCLLPTGPHVFVQSRTGNALTSDSVYSIVSRSCYKHSGKKTNPHLLRDMIVTHVRNSNASEKELEALALYMGHSISMQRTSYDRRTAEQKVAPAVNLLRNVNELGNGEDTTDS